VLLLGILSNEATFVVTKVVRFWKNLVVFLDSLFVDVMGTTATLAGVVILLQCGSFAAWQMVISASSFTTYSCATY
jgi:hypothetical protein